MNEQATRPTDEAPTVLEIVGSSPTGWCDPISGTCAVAPGKAADDASPLPSDEHDHENDHDQES